MLSIRIIDITPPINSTTYFYEAYLSRGTVDTSWTPAPEDDAEEIIGLKSEIKQTAERIHLTVGRYGKRNITTVNTCRENRTNCKRYREKLNK